MATVDSLFVNICMVISLTYLFSLTYRDWRTEHRVEVLLLRALCCSVGAILLMFHGIPLGDNIQMDLRMVPIVLFTLRYGLGYGTVAVIPMVITRVLFFPQAPSDVYALSGLLTFLMIGLIRLRMGNTTSTPYLLTPLLIFSLQTLPVFLSSHAERFFSQTFIWYFLANVIGFYLSAQILQSRLAYLRATEHLQKEALTDALTGLFNRRQFERDQGLFGGGDVFLMLDLDHFKHINDRYGHSMGDDVLRQISALLQNSTRDHDRLYRMGGEEFLVVLRGTDAQQAFLIAERIREAVAEHLFPMPEQVTLSGGLVECPPRPDLQKVLDQGDVLLYSAKRQGRNQIQQQVQDPQPSTSREASRDVMGTSLL
ncbi:GGDEF domain-containing protein [Deinococcus roseus]|uniref:GGDEF domain-containing protein n=1 Tax=Deinococcus roseus TaxID=392414 RepID=A0ABQ2D1N1_9DEIO|nr:diguanylate cyclase [Deinococcus roseus]GGJ39240.1 GGDEF domain-containing protein [Deinococcus roseus]